MQNSFSRTMKGTASKHSSRIRSEPNKEKEDGSNFDVVGDVLQSQYTTYDSSVNNELLAQNLKTFIYFGYGSNMLETRIHIQNPTAKRIGIGQLNNYRLDFHTSSKRWLGSPATVVPDQNHVVFGALWEIDICNLADLDDQEGVNVGMYRAINLPIKHTSGVEKIARIYLLVSQPTIDREKFRYDDVPLDRQPSKTYLQCLVKGAIETGIHTEYIDWLKAVKHNGNVVKELESKLGLEDIEL